jgi:predicted Rossmann fold flavoprotein
LPLTANNLEVQPQTKIKHYDAIVVGAGAAGLLCASTAALRGRSVLIVEKSNKIGKKILMSGGGRCNFTNYTIEAEHFISANPHFCKAALKRYNQWDFIALVDKHQIEYEERKHTQLFCKKSAKDILAMLLKECADAKVEIVTHCDITSISATGDDSQPSYKLNTTHNSQDQSYSCTSLVVATGALSIPTLGGSGLGYNLAKQFGLELTERQAGLVPFMFSDALKPFCESLAGLTLDVDVTCLQNEKNSHLHFFKPNQHHTLPNFNESLLFTHRGISGPAILQVSNYWYPGDHISINLLPGINAFAWLTDNKDNQGRMRLSTLLQQLLPKAFVNEIVKLWWPSCGDKPMAELNDKTLEDIGRQLNCWLIKPSATEGYRTAEVTLGGVNTDAISSKTMEVKAHKGLFFVGEVLDVTGHLGGYNFQWAWSSGYSAGIAV